MHYQTLVPQKAGFLHKDYQSALSSSGRDIGVENATTKSANTQDVMISLNVYNVSLSCWALLTSYSHQYIQESVLVQQLMNSEKIMFD